MKKRTLILTLVTAIIIGLVSALSLTTVGVSADDASVWDGTVADGFDGGSGTEEDPYQIATPAQWAYFAQCNNDVDGARETGKYYVLTANLVFNIGDSSDWEDEAPANDLTDYVIGPVCNVNPFVGTLDGQGHTISGVYINKTGGSCGLFGSTAAGETAVIKNLVITNSYYESDGSGEAGALIGQTSGGETYIDTVFVTDSVYIKSAGTSNGGFIGHNGGNGYGTPTIYIDNSVNGATIDAGGQQYVGGFIGNGNNNPLYINNCLNYGTVKGGTNYLAGFVGRDDYAGSEINNSVNIGTVTPTSGSNYRQFIMSNSGSKKPILTNCLAIGTNYGKNTTNNDCAQITSEEFITAGFLATESGQKLGADWIELSEKISDDNGEIITTEICVPKALKDAIEVIPSTSLYSKTLRTKAPVWVIEAYDNKVIEIDSVEKYKEFVDFFNGKYAEECKDGADGITVKLTKNLFFNTGDAATWGEEAPENDMTGYIIGSWANPFRGVFDGQGYTISGFYAKKTTEDGDTVGVIGCTAYGKEATIQNLIITNSYFESEAGTVAACVAQAEGGITTIKNIYVTDSVYVVSGHHYAGGVMAHVGQGSFDTPEVVIDSCVNAATVTATGTNGTSIGGILGNGNQKIVTVTNCLNTGDISGYKYASGIVGFGKSSSNEVYIAKCINVGTITAEYTSEDNDEGKSCSIVCFAKDIKDAVKAEDCYYLAETAEFGVYQAGEYAGESIFEIDDIAEITGSDVAIDIVDTLTDWSVREDLIMIPTALIDFDLEAEPEEDPIIIDPIETDPVETDPVETDPVETDPVETDPVETDPVETDPVETETDPVSTEPSSEPVATEPSSEPTTEKPAQSGGCSCGGITTIAAAMLAAIAGLSVAFITKKK